ncbi:hypothetical protein A2526_05070 [candidate division WOR-1 bacterium RIFOXYD2_FULL_36_8]|nr:MAG: hypothetical protein A2230_05305 [candidate division WOR-1 bacterium RIFOXYA2_FULL_36_21]OGC14500.1 MAG: hypothetical protein A2282_09365 [candidate division WOR-1 bacterium RIFOXYA12_FULL_36_13]OGC38290.1 MAG: hypothetical protein A2526_05070 [candidate division WOR-1 bacterium RIFOXYD2_FULL_36_8]
MRMDKVNINGTSYFKLPNQRTLLLVLPRYPLKSKFQGHPLADAISISLGITNLDAMQQIKTSLENDPFATVEIGQAGIKPVEVDLSQCLLFELCSTFAPHITTRDGEDKSPEQLEVRILERLLPPGLFIEQDNSPSKLLEIRDNLLRFGVNLAAGILKGTNKTVKITSNEKKLLDILIQDPKYTVSLEEVRIALNLPNIQATRCAIRRIVIKLNTINSPLILINIHGTGYQLCARSTTRQK